MSEVEISFHRKKFLCIRRNFLLQKETSCHGKEFHAIVRNFLSQEEISCQRQKCHVTGRNFLSQKETSCRRNELYATVEKNLSQEEIPKLPLFWTSFVASDSRCFGRNFWLKVVPASAKQLMVFSIQGCNDQRIIYVGGPTWQAVACKL